MPEPDPLRWKALAVVCAAFFMTVLDVSIVNVGMPSISKALHFSADQPAVGDHGLRDHVRRLPAARPAVSADLLGRRRVFLRRRHGVHYRVVPLRARLVGGRADRRARPAGLRRPIISPGGALDHHHAMFEEGPERNTALGIWGAIGGSGAAVGVLAGGVLTKYAGWEWIFFVNVPVGAHPRAWRRGTSVSISPARARRISPGRSRSPRVSPSSCTGSRTRLPTAGHRPGRSLGSRLPRSF